MIWSTFYPTCFRIRFLSLRILILNNLRFAYSPGVISDPCLPSFPYLSWASESREPRRFLDGGSPAIQVFLAQTGR